MSNKAWLNYLVEAGKICKESATYATLSLKHKQEAIKHTARQLVKIKKEDRQ